MWYKDARALVGVDEPVTTRDPAMLRPKGQKHSKGRCMNKTQFFDQLRTRGWVLYVPERVANAHRDSLLSGWRLSPHWGHDRWGGIRPILDLIEANKLDLKIPFLREAKPDRDGGHYIISQYRERENFIEQHVANLMLYDADNPPPLPEERVDDDSLWDSLVSQFQLTESLTNRILSCNGWVYRVRFTPVWVKFSEPLPYGWIWKGDPPEKKRAEREADEIVRTKRRKLRKEYGLTGQYFGRSYTRRPLLMILRKAYPPEQVRRVRRQLEDKVRKDPAEAVRYGLERGLLA